MNYVLILVTSGIVLLSGTVGYLLGKYHSHLTEHITELMNRQPELPKVEEPTITAGVYQEPKQASNDNAVGLIETKTPQQLDWEFQNELADLEHSK